MNYFVSLKQGHLNSLKHYKCTEFSCDEFISDNAIKNFRLIKYYNVNKEYSVKFYQKKKDQNDEDMPVPQLSKKEILNLIYKVL